MFTGDGCLEDKYKMEVDSIVKPVQLPNGQVPMAMIKPLKEELCNVEEYSHQLTTFATPFERYR